MCSELRVRKFQFSSVHSCAAHKPLIRPPVFSARSPYRAFLVMLIYANERQVLVCVLQSHVASLPWLPPPPPPAGVAHSSAFMPLPTPLQKSPIEQRKLPAADLVSAGMVCGRAVCTPALMCLEHVPSVLSRCWLGGRKGIRPVNKKLSYRRVTARCVLSVVILPITTQQCRNYLNDKS